MADPQTIDPVTGLPKTGTQAPWIGSQPQVNDSMAAQVTALASKDSPLNQMARTEGLKVANRRGLLNSSMAVDASQDAVLRNIMPIASQDASQAFQKNQAARAFEYGMTAQENQQGWQTAENIAQRGFLGTQADLDRTLQQTLQTQQLDVQQSMQIKQIASTEGIEAANRQLAQTLQENDITFRMKEGNLDRAAALQAQQNDIAFQTNQNALSRDLQDRIAKMNLSGTQQAGAAQMVNNTQAAYQAEYQSIQNNTNLTSAQRTDQLTAANNRYRNGLYLVEQTYNIDLQY